MLCFGKGFKGSGCFPDAVCRFPNRQSMGVYGKTASNFHKITAFLFSCHLAIILFLVIFSPNPFYKFPFWWYRVWLYLHDFTCCLCLWTDFVLQYFFRHIDTVLLCLNNIFYAFQVLYIYRMYISHIHLPLPSFNFLWSHHQLQIFFIFVNNHESS